MLRRALAATAILVLQVSAARAACKPERSCIEPSFKVPRGFDSCADEKGVHLVLKNRCDHEVMVFACAEGLDGKAKCRSWGVKAGAEDAWSKFMWCETTGATKWFAYDAAGHCPTEKLCKDGMPFSACRSE